MVRRQSGLMARMDQRICSFQVLRVPRRVEQGRREPPLRQSASQSAQSFRVGGECDRQLLIFCLGSGDEFRQADGVEQTGRHAAGKGFPGEREDR